MKFTPYNYSLKDIKDFQPRGIILSGGPSSVYQEDAPQSPAEIFDLDIPVLGICYGMQLMALQLGGRVAGSSEREYGYASLMIDDNSDLLKGLSSGEQAWMSHTDRIEQLPEGFQRIAHTNNSPTAAMKNERKALYGVQFHPEVVHTPKGIQILSNFIFTICGSEPVWNMASFIEESVKSIRERVGSERVICGLSGGVDSSVAAALIHRAIGNQLTCIFVDNGVLRSGESEEVIDMFGDHFKIDLRFAQAGERFLKNLEGVEDPERKRKIIGEEFIHVFEEEARKNRQGQISCPGDSLS